MKKNMTKHAQKDRANRIEYICDNVGIGEELFTVVTNDEKHGKRRMCVTTTGLVIVRAIDNNVVITLFIGKYSQILKLWKEKTGMDTLPHGLSETIKRNQYHREMCPAA